ncbi:class I SAM-dependent methyltransferase [Candidatus Bathyarchaeota archaeon]|nr:class I SAM-dependent methyltransferase [Candidatus Bathyarchaeota archaeon]
MSVWWEVEDALESIIEDYERVNHVISFFQDEKARRKGLKMAGPQTGVGLELGSGPGNFTPMLHEALDGSLVCLDYSDRMLRVGWARNREQCVGFVRAIFEALPFRKGIVSFAAGAYALRDTPEKERALEEISFALREGGNLLVVDIGRPNNWLVRNGLSLYIRFIVPAIAGIMAGYGYRNPWSLLYKTYLSLPVNRVYEGMMTEIVGRADLDELALGGLIVATAVKGK